MKKKYAETDYVYANARIHYNEGFLLNEDKYKRLASCTNLEDFKTALHDYGYETKENTDIYFAIEKKLEDNFNFASSLIQNGHVLDVMKLPYDCNNIKSAIKCQLTTGFDFKYLYSNCGTVSYEKCLDASINDDYSAFYPNMEKACKNIKNIYAETQDPQLIDLKIDVACFKDMYEIAKNSGEQKVLEYVKDRIDIINVKNAIRVAEMMKDDDFANSIFIPNGDIDKKTIDSIRKDIDNVSLILNHTKFEQVIQNTPRDFTHIENVFEKYLEEKIAIYKNTMFGIEPILRYMVACEYESKRVRTILSSVFSKMIS